MAVPKKKGRVAKIAELGKDDTDVGERRLANGKQMRYVPGKSWREVRSGNSAEGRDTMEEMQTACSKQPAEKPAGQQVWGKSGSKPPAKDRGDSARFTISRTTLIPSSNWSQRRGGKVPAGRLTRETLCFPHFPTKHLDQPSREKVPL